MPDTQNVANDSSLLTAWGMSSNHYPDQTAVWSIVNGAQAKKEDGAVAKYSGVSVGSMAFAIYDSIFGGFLKGFRDNKPKPLKDSYTEDFNDYKKSIMEYKIPDFSYKKPKAAVPENEEKPAAKPIIKAPADEKKADDVIEKMKKYQPAKVFEDPNGNRDIYIVLENIGNPSVNVEGASIENSGNSLNAISLFPGELALKPYDYGNPYHW